MESCSDIWDVLHDAIIIAAEGTIPGIVSLRIECDHLRDRFIAPGTAFILTLDGCAKFEFRSWQEELSITTSVEAIGQLRLWLLSAERREEQCRVRCQFLGREGGGSLEVVAESAQLVLDTGDAISWAQISAVASAYWIDFSHGVQVQPTPANDLRKRIRGTEILEQLERSLAAEGQFETALELTPGTLGLFIDRYLNGELSANDLENIAEHMELRVEYLPESMSHVIAQVLFEISTPDVNGAITAERAGSWKSALTDMTRP